MLGRRVGMAISIVSTGRINGDLHCLKVVLIITDKTSWMIADCSSVYNVITIVR